MAEKEFGREFKKVLEDTPKNEDFRNSLALRLTEKFTMNAKYRRIKEQEWIQALRQHKGIYDPETMAKIPENASKVYPKLTRSKDNMVLSRLNDMLFPELDRNYSLDPTPVPRVSVEVANEIKKALVQVDPQTGMKVLPTRDMLEKAVREYCRNACSKMQQEMDDQLLEMRYDVKVAKPALRSAVIYGTGIVKGPLVEGKKKKVVWTQKGDSFIPEEQTHVTPVFEFIPVWNWFPDMNVVDYEDAEGTFERHVMSKHDVRKLALTEGFNKALITEYLSEHASGDYTPMAWENDLRGINTTTVTKNTFEAPEPGSTMGIPTDRKYQVLEYWGWFDADDLLTSGAVMSEDVSPEAEVYANVWMLGPHIIKAAKIDPVGGMDAYKLFYYEKDETSIFGEGLPILMRHSQISIAAASRMMLNNAAICCLTGDTVVYREGQKRGHSPVTLGEIWDKKGKHNSGMRRLKLRSLDFDTGEFFSNRVVDILDNGMADVFEVRTEKGYQIKATGNHRFLRDDGEWQELDEFDVGNMIAVNGQPLPSSNECIDCGASIGKTSIRCRSCAMKKTHPREEERICSDCGKETSAKGVLRCRKCASKMENSKWNQKQVAVARENVYALHSTARRRYECQTVKKDFCESCGVSREDTYRLNVHHKDKTPWNNEPSNLQTLCDACHMAHHAKESSFGDSFLHRYVSYDRIVSIEYVGQERVFDLCMTGPNHNFVANGFVSHNSSPQFEINYSLMLSEDLTNIFGGKVWLREGKGMDAQYPALRVYAIESHIDEYLSIIQAFKQFGDEETTLPTWMISEPTRTTNETAQGVSMRQGSVTIALKDIVKNFDDFTEACMGSLYAWNMEFNSRDEIKGDYQVSPKGSTTLVTKEVMMQALNNFVQTLTPEDWMYIPRRDLLEQRIKANDLPIELRTEEDADKLRQGQVDQEAMAIQKDQMKADVDKTKAMALNFLTKSKKTNKEAVTVIGEPPLPPAPKPRPDSTVEPPPPAGVFPIR